MEDSDDMLLNTIGLQLFYVNYCYSVIRTKMSVHVQGCKSIPFYLV